MIEELYYHDVINPNITAATIGVSKNKWVAIRESEIDGNNYLTIMQENRFNILPIISSDGQAYEYFKSVSLNDYSAATREIITYKDTIALDTGIKELIFKFGSMFRSHFFLTLNGKVSGLVSLSNLNTRSAQVYIFSLVCELERTLSEFIRDNVEEEVLLQNLKEKAKTDNKIRSLVKNYNKLLSEDFENSITENLYFKQFFEIVKEFNLHILLGYSSNEEWEELYSMNKLRNSVAHPSKSLINKDQTIEFLQSKLDQIDDLLFRLRHQKNPDRFSSIT
ncbi:hypothetical protein [Pontibacter burrus]|uniref:Uncharacterized protein n=1 Tax=Pontibacter burrus TaxID=2704466 RepID=A0A6B3LUE2_9BACT|nr:hypothetical protein [Pontibacter burrus]NEM97187.1 hypothetical protein [Pontibacter burrus]